MQNGKIAITRTNQACGRTLKWTIAKQFSPSPVHCKLAGPFGIVVITDSHLVHKIQHNTQLQNVRRADSIDIAMASQTSLKLERKGPVGNECRKRDAAHAWFSKRSRVGCMICFQYGTVDDFQLPNYSMIGLKCVPFQPKHGQTKKCNDTLMHENARQVQH